MYSRQIRQFLSILTRRGNFDSPRPIKIHMTKSISDSLNLIGFQFIVLFNDVVGGADGAHGGVHGDQVEVVAFGDGVIQNGTCLRIVIGVGNHLDHGPLVDHDHSNVDGFI